MRGPSVLGLLCLVIGVAATAQVSTQQSGNFCQGCRAIVSFSQTFNTTEQRDDYKGAFKNFCELYHPPSTDFQQGPCPLFVEGLYQILDRVDPVRHCDQIGACGPTEGVAYPSSAELAAMTPKQADVICKFCEQSVEQVQNALSDPKTIDMVRRQADQLCDYLRLVDADKECRQLLDKYLDQAIKFVQDIDPLAYCRSVRLCPARRIPSATSSYKAGLARSRAAASAARQHQRRLPTLVDFNDFGIETSVVVGERPTNEAKPRTPNCMLCKTLVKEMFHFLRENKTEANIMSGLGQVCQMLFPRGQKLDECQSMVRAYTREIIQLLIDETDPGMICVLLEQCTSNRRAAYEVDVAAESSVRPRATSDAHGQRRFDLGDLISALDPSAALKSARVCFECKMFVKYLRTSFEEPKSRDYIKEWLQANLCDSIPDKQTREQCSRLIDQYADTFFAAVVGSLDPSTACADLGACTRKTLNRVLQIDTLAPFDKPDELPTLVVSPKPQEARQSQREPRPRPQQQAAAPKVKEQAAVGGQLCDQCEQVVTQIDEYLANHPVDKDVSVLIDQVCNKLPDGSVRSQCVAIIKIFGSEIAQAVATMDNPHQLCTKIMMC